MNIFEINTTSDKESNFYLLTDINRAAIESVMNEMVQEERAEGSDIFYVNDEYVANIKKLFPFSVVVHYEKIPLIKI